MHARLLKMVPCQRELTRTCSAKRLLTMAACKNRLIALTGSTGFIGRYLACELPKFGYRIRVLLRCPSDLPFDGAGTVIGDLAKPQNLIEALSGAYAVIHTAGLPRQ